MQVNTSSRIKLVLSDESQINIGADSRIRIEITKPQSPSVINLLKGWIRAKVMKDLEALDPKAKAKLIIKTNSGGMVIRGTEFEVTYSEVGGEGTSQLDVIEGVVELIDYHLGSVTKVMAGQSGTVFGPVDNWLEEEDYEAIPTLAPEIVVFDSESNELSSDLSRVDWGTVATGNNGVEKSFLIRNIWTSDLSDITISISGVNSADYIVTGPALNQLPGGAATDLMVKFRPSASGARTATLKIASNDADENPFVIGLTGTGSTNPADNSYTAWQIGFFNVTQLANPAISGDLADFDKDGVPNLLEYLLGSNPTLPSSGLLPTVTKAPGSNNLVFTYKRKIAATGVTQVIEHSTSLSAPVTFFRSANPSYKRYANHTHENNQTLRRRIQKTCRRNAANFWQARRSNRPRTRMHSRFPANLET